MLCDPYPTKTTPDSNEIFNVQKGYRAEMEIPARKLWVGLVFGQILFFLDFKFLASQDALEVMGVTECLTD